MSIKINNKNCMNFYYFIMGLLLSGLSVSLFYVPNNILATGGTGISMLINNFIDIDVSVLLFLISSITLIISFIVYGPVHSSKDILGTILLPVFIKATSLLVNVIKFENVSLFLLVLVGGVLSGIGFGLIKKSGYSLGGLYVIYDLIHDKFKISISKANFIVNFIILFLGIYVYGFSETVYAFVALYVSSTVADKVIMGISNNKTFYIVTKNPEEIKEFIINNIHSTATVVSSKGGYSNKNNYIIISSIPTLKYNIVKEFVKEIDKNAFFLITDSYYVSK